MCLNGLQKPRAFPHLHRGTILYRMPRQNFLNTIAFSLAFSALFSTIALAQAQPDAQHTLDTYNYVIGTQTFHPTYQFTKEEPLLETANAIHDLGCTVIKFGLERNYAGMETPNGKRRNVREATPNIHSLLELVRDEPTHKKVLDMPFSNFILWTHTFSNDANWREGFDEEKQKSEYREIYDLTQYLLTNYSGTGKTFYLGHWEGDGWLRGSVKKADDVNITPLRIQGMIDWLNTRQRAIDDAKKDTPHHDVQVWHYTEVNHVKLAMDENRPALVNKVLPHTHVDFVSYSSYDTMNDPELLKRALTYIESKLPPKPGFKTKRVFVGEFGFPSNRFSPQEQDQKSRAVLKAALEWGCPFALYWEMYNNELDAQHRQRGFWMIDDKGNKQPIYYTYKHFYERARQYVSDFTRDHARPPTLEEFEHTAVDFLND
jgi:hypothetical protein